MTEKIENGDESPSQEFHNLATKLAIAEIRAMVRRLQETGDFQLPNSIDFDKLDLRTAKFIKNQLRDTLRTLGGGRSQ